MPRKKNHKKPLPAATTEAVCETLIDIARDRKWDPTRIAKEIQEFYFEHDTVFSFKDDELIEEDFLLHTDTIRRIIADCRIASHGTAKSLFLWLSAKFPVELRSRLTASKELFVASCREAFGHTPNPRPDKMERFSGRYKLFRPFHMDPRHRFTVELLTIGSSDSPFDCSLSCRYVEDGILRGTDSKGHAVPHGPKIFLLLSVEGDRHSNLLIYFDRVERDYIIRQNGEERDVIGMSGNMIASVGTIDPASAWPCFARRLGPDEDFEPFTSADGDIAALPERAKDALARGAIYWRAEDFPFPFAELAS